jgi:predicted secreted protein
MIALVHDVALFGAFAILWFLALLIVLPIGAGGHDASVAGADPGAPARPRILFKAGLATGIAIVLWAIFYLLIALGVLDI